MEEKNRRGSIAEGVSASKREGWEKRKGFNDLRENEFEELDGVIVQFPELRGRSQYVQEITIFSGAHN